MKKIVYFLIVMSMIMIGCGEDNDKLVVTVDESGSLTVKVLNDNDELVENANVKVCLQEYSSIALFSGNTDLNGYCVFDPILKGNYWVSADVESDDNVYMTAGIVQVVADFDQEMILRPFDNVGKVKVKIIQGDQTPIVNMNVAFISRPHYSNIEYTHEMLLSESVDIQKTDSYGWVVFERLPLGINGYLSGSVYLYNDAGFSNYPYESITASNNLEQSYLIEIY